MQLLQGLNCPGWSGHQTAGNLPWRKTSQPAFQSWQSTHDGKLFSHRSCNRSNRCSSTLTWTAYRRALLSVFNQTSHWDPDSSHFSTLFWACVDYLLMERHSRLANTVLDNRRSFSSSCISSIHDGFPVLFIASKRCHIKFVPPFSWIQLKLANPVKTSLILAGPERTFKCVFPSAKRFILN